MIPITQILRKSFNTFVNPFVYDPNKYYSVSDALSPERVRTGAELSEGQKLADVGGKAVALAAGWSVLAFAAHKAMRARREKQSFQKMKEYLQSAHPVMNFNPDVNPEQDKAVEEMGLTDPNEKLAADPIGLDRLAEPASAGLGSDAPFSPLSPLDVLRRFRLESKGGTRTSSMLMPASLLVPPLALYFAWRGSEKLSDIQQKRNVEKRLDEKKDVLNRLMWEETAPEKTAGELDRPLDVAHANLPSENFLGIRSLGSFKDWFSKRAPSLLTEPGALLTDPEGSMHTAKGMLTAYAVASFALAGVAAHRYFANQDPVRKKHKAVEDVVRRSMLLNRAPQFMAVPPEPEEKKPSAIRTPVPVET